MGKERVGLGREKGHLAWLSGKQPVPKVHYYVYLLECADESLYTGITTDVARRFEEHKSGKGGHYTRSRGISRIRYTEKHQGRGSAQKREAEIKKWRKKKKLDLIKFAGHKSHKLNQ